MRRWRVRCATVAGGEDGEPPFPGQALMVEAAVLRHDDKATVLQRAEGLAHRVRLHVQSSGSFAQAQPDIAVVEAVVALCQLNKQRSGHGIEASPCRRCQHEMRKLEVAC